VLVPRLDLLNLLLATRSKEDRSERPRLLIAYRDGLLRPRRKEGPICRELKPRRDMDDASYGMWLRLLERLVGPEADDGQSERIHGKLVVLYVLPEDIGDGSRPTLALQFAMVRRIRKHLQILNAC
jgi:hypothetical protein